MCLMSGLPDSAVIWCTIASGREVVTASITESACRPSITMASAPACRRVPSLAGLVVVAIT
jgi:hypothetical protein